MKLLVALLLLLAAPASAQTWTRAHGGADNASFADVDTSPATRSSLRSSAPGLGPFAPGVGPVIGPSGDAYLGTTDGRLIDVTINGRVRWTATLPPARKVFASPMVGSDGSIYVAASVGLGPDPRDHRPIRAWLYKFDNTGAQVWERPLPVIGQSSGAALALNGTGTGTNELILVAAAEYPTAEAVATALTGFSPDGTQLFTQGTGGASDGLAGEPDRESWFACIFDQSCWFGITGFHEVQPPTQPGSRLPAAALLPAEVHASAVSIAIAADNSIVVSDGYRGLRGYRALNGTLTPLFEKIHGSYLTSGAAELPNLHGVYGVWPGRVGFAGPSLEPVSDIWQAERDHEIGLEASPTRLASGRVVTVDRDGRVMVVDRVTPVARITLSAQTIAPAAASRGFYYVSTVTGLVTLDAGTNEQVGRFAWTGGGQSSPAISKTGSVYALAGDTLFIFDRSATNVRDHRDSGTPPPRSAPQPGTTRDHRTTRPS